MEQLHTDGSQSQTNSKDSLISYKKVERTPFTMVTIQNDHFGVLGDKRVTEIFENIEELEEELKKTTWDRLMQVIWITTEKVVELKQLEALKNK